MNYTRILLAAVAATFVDAIYGFVVYGNLLTSQFALFPGVYRPVEAQVAYLPVLFVGMFLAILAASAIYAKSCRGGSGILEGLRFGVLIALVEVGYAVIVGYAISNIDRRITAYMTVAAFVEWVLVSMAIGLVYKPSASASH